MRALLALVLRLADLAPLLSPAPLHNAWGVGGTVLL